jgi:uncharacterized Zn finger protein
MENGIKKCPFCGGQAKLFHEANSNDVLSFYVRCTNCFVQTQKVKNTRRKPKKTLDLESYKRSEERYLRGEYYAIRFAVETWNNRFYER